MDIKLHTIPIRELVEGYVNNEEEGVVGYGGKLNIRPKFQREFVYNTKQQQEVIYSILKNFPLNVMYWIVNSEGGYELLDGQQRTISICSFYVERGLQIKWGGKENFFQNLTPEQQEDFLNYELQVYICENGTKQEQLDWFEIINIAGERLTNQEVRNAVYSGPWVTAAKQWFSKTGCPAYQIGEKYVKGTPIRQDYLEKVIKWMCDKDGIDKIETYMAIHQNDSNADREWQYFQAVISWVKTLFPTYRREMKGVEWGLLYNKYKDNEYSSSDLEKQVKQLMMDEYIQKREGIYYYVFSGEEKVLNLRGFSDTIKRAVFEEQNGICPRCGKQFKFEEMEGDHKIPWSKGGTTTKENCQMLCKSCNGIKSDN